MLSPIRLCCIALSLLPGMARAAGGPNQVELDAAHRSADWLMINHDYAGQRYVDLEQVTRDNAAQLRPVCMYQVGDTQHFSANPLVYRGIMYITVAGPLYETAVDGKARKLVAVGGKDGLLRAIDRETREELHRTPVTTRSNVDAKPTLDGTHTCPGVLGGMQWSAPALNPRLGTLYAPAVDWCGVFRKADELRYVPGHLYMGGSFTYDPIEKSTGWLTAVDSAIGAVQWRYASSRPLVGAVTATSADLVFTGEMSGDFLTLDGRTGEVLYRFNIGGPIPGGVITYAVNGKQYVAAASGGMAGFWSAPPGAATIVVFALP